MVKYKYSDEDLTIAVTQSLSVTDVMRNLGVTIAGGNHLHISNRIKKLELDCTHFTGGRHNRGKSPHNKKTPAEILVLLDKNSPRVPGKRLTKCLLEIGREYTCEMCGIGDEYRGKPNVLEVDHINVRKYDNRPENLRFLCVFCHDYISRYQSKLRYEGKLEFYSERIDSHLPFNNKDRSTKEPRIIGTTLCGICKIEISKGSYLCKICYRSNKLSKIPKTTKIDWPIDNDLIDMVKSTSYLATSKVLGVSDNAIRKRLKNRGYDLKNL